VHDVEVVVINGDLKLKEFKKWML